MAETGFGFAVAARRRGRDLALALVAVGAAVLLLAGSQAPTVRASVTGLGIGILSVDGTFRENVTLPVSGNYYLTIATDDGTSYVNASVAFNGSVLAQDNRSLGASTQVSLPAGNYTVSLAGHGRAALGWDFTNGSIQEFPDNATLVAFLAPSGERVHVAVALGDATNVSLHLYDDGLRLVGNASVTASGTVDFILPTQSDSVAYLTATVVAGTPNGRYGLSWTSGPLNPPIDFTAWPWFLLWILVPMAVAAVVVVLLHRQRGRRGLGP